MPGLQPPAAAAQQARFAVTPASTRSAFRAMRSFNSAAMLARLVAIVRPRECTNSAYAAFRTSLTRRLAGRTKIEMMVRLYFGWLPRV